MRAYEVLLENANIKDIKKYILKNCQPYLNDIGGIQNIYKYVLYRGANIDSGVKIIEPYKKRRPMITAKELHAAASQAMDELGIKARRDNSIFVTGSMGEAGGYGSIFVAVPIGEYDFSWSKRVFDFSTESNIQYFVRQRIITSADSSITRDDMLRSYFTYEQIHELIDDGNLKINYEKLRAFFEKHYKTTDIKKAIQSNNEIMINGRCLLIDAVLFRRLRI